MKAQNELVLKIDKIKRLNNWMDCDYVHSLQKEAEEAIIAEHPLAEKMTQIALDYAECVYSRSRKAKGWPIIS